MSDTYKWERREKKIESKKSRIKKHGKSLGYIYKNSIEKRLEKSNTSSL